MPQQLKYTKVQFEILHYIGWFLWFVVTAGRWAFMTQERLCLTLQATQGANLKLDLFG